MILTALKQYYDRLHNEPERNIPEFGFSREKISWELLLTQEGKLLQVNDLRISETNEKGKTRFIPCQMIVPTTTHTASRSGANPPPNFLWDNTGFVLGSKKKAGDSLKKLEKFKQLNFNIGNGLNDIGMQAVLKFTSNWESSEIQNWKNWQEISTTNLVFRLDGEKQWIHERPTVVNAWIDYCHKDESSYNKDKKGEGKVIIGTCLLSGKIGQLSRVHRQLSGVQGGNPTGQTFVSFNENAYLSYGKEQSFNAPISIEAAFQYTTALNYLLRYGSRQRVKIGDATTVFWTGRDSPVEGFLGFVFNPGDDKADEQEVRRFLEAVRDGKSPPDIDDLDCPFYVLGLSPNQARISVRFWHISTIDDISKKIGWHFNDLRLERSFDSEPEFPGMWQLLLQIAHLNKANNIPPLLSGAFMQSILTGRPYPANLLSTIIMRIRADQAKKDKRGKTIQNVNYLRAAMIKAFLNRKNRTLGKEEEITMSLDQISTNVAYRLGRLFAVLEKAQRSALRGINTTIKDRYFGSASATPRVVFPQLIRLSQHHIQKAEYGHYYDRMVEEILGAINDFPSHLNLDDQGKFALGYYHQRQYFYASNNKDKEE